MCAVIGQEDDIQLGTTLGDAVVNFNEFASTNSTSGNASDGSSSGSSGLSSQITVEEFKPPPPPPSPPLPPPPIPRSPEPPAVPGKPGRPVIRYPPTIFEAQNKDDEEYNYLVTWIGVAVGIFAFLGCLGLTKLYLAHSDSKPDILTPFPEKQTGKPGGGFLSRLDTYMGADRSPGGFGKSPSTREPEYLSPGLVAVNGQVATVSVPKTAFYQKRLERSQTNVVALHIQKVVRHFCVCNSPVYQFLTMLHGPLIHNPSTCRARRSEQRLASRKAKQTGTQKTAMPKPGFAKPMVTNHQQPLSSQPSGPQQGSSTVEETGLVVPVVMPEKISRTSIAGSPYFKSNLKHQNRLLN
ncbi:hypothetical protein CYMTET_56822 [Cymbomonas tetramitiformis]|uniref:Uncharacterized protein n=1 Tax=Cymbomonas tetramitiformis TaxID=36881 RepID=A0AAE0BBJ7_9CHLO|nr:hypothetical protein CYMTET_56822 [Cymbomonas tetramitiformis]